MKEKYIGATVNERLYLGGLIDEFYKAIDEKNYYRAKQILEEVELTEESIRPILENAGLFPPTDDKPTV